MQVNIQTDHQIAHNKPDIILHDKNDNSVLIIDIAIPNDYNVIHKRAEKLRNYTDLAVELKCLNPASSSAVVQYDRHESEYSTDPSSILLFMASVIVFIVLSGTSCTNDCFVSRHIPPNIHCCGRMRPALFFRLVKRLSSTSTIKPSPPIF